MQNTNAGGLPMSSSVGLSQGIFINGQYNSQPITGRSPLVGTKLGKLIMGGKLGAHQARQNFIR